MVEKTTTTICSSAKGRQISRSQVDTLHTTPIIRVNMDGHTRKFLVDTGSSLSLIQAGISPVTLTRAEVTPYVVTGDQLNFKGEQDLRYKINGQMYSHSFCVCALTTDADAIVGTDFLRKVEAKIDL
jgi:hypothetical protein